MDVYASDLTSIGCTWGVKNCTKTTKCNMVVVIVQRHASWLKLPCLGRRLVPNSSALINKNLQFQEIILIMMSKATNENGSLTWCYLKEEIQLIIHIAFELLCMDSVSV
jgi:hypothetical protein